MAEQLHFNNLLPLFFITEDFDYVRLNHTQSHSNKRSKGKPARLYGRGGYGTIAPLWAWRLQSTRVSSGVVVVKTHAPSGGAVTKPPRLFGRGGYETPAPLRAGRLRNPCASSGGAVTKPPRLFGRSGYETPAPLRPLQLQGAVTKPPRLFGRGGVTKRPRLFERGGYETPAPLRAGKLRNPHVSSSAVVI